jgi:Coenzyme PQQ synthesis protein D (PqqD)
MPTVARQGNTARVQPEQSGLFKRSAQQVSCKIDDEVAILHLERAMYFGVQGVGVQIWEALEQPRSLADLCAIVTAEFDVSPGDCEADIVVFLASLEKEGLVEVAAQP